MLSKALLGFSVPDNQLSMTAHYDCMPCHHLGAADAEKEATLAADLEVQLGRMLNEATALRAMVEDAKGGETAAKEEAAKAVELATSLAARSQDPLWTHSVHLSGYAIMLDTPLCWIQTMPWQQLT